MSTGFKMKCIQDIIKNISLPTTNSVVINEDNMRICYRLQGTKKYRYICLKTREEIAIFLREKGKIEMFSIQGDRVRLFVKQVVTKEENHKPVQHIKLVEVALDTLSFTQGELMHYAAEHEYRQKCTMLGLAKAKIIKFSTEIFRAA